MILTLLSQYSSLLMTGSWSWSLARPVYASALHQLLKAVCLLMGDFLTTAVDLMG
jgi:hypothetical protein